MKKNIAHLAIIIASQLCVTNLFSQSVSINTDGTTAHSSAILDIKSITKGMLAPRMNTVQRTAIATPAAGLLVYDTDTNSFWFYNGSAWTNLSASGTLGWLLTGNTATNPATHFIGTTDNTNLRFKINNTNAGYLTNDGNVFWGLRSGNSNTSGYSNIAIGTDALKLNTALSNLVAIGDSALFNNGTNVGNPTFGIENTAIGSKALYTNINGWANTAIGYRALFANIYGDWNTAIGHKALVTNDEGSQNTAIGKNAMFYNSKGNDNIAIGVNALLNNTTASHNTAIGNNALYTQSFSNGSTAWISGNTAIGSEALAFNNPTATNNGINNTAVGFSALRANTTGYENTGLGVTALYSNTTGFRNIAIGRQAMFYNTDGDENTAIGYKALRYNNGDGNTAYGNNALEENTTGQFNVAIGWSSFYKNITGDYNVAIGTASLYKNITGDYNVAIGLNASNDSTNSSNNILIGANSHIAANVNNSIVIGYGAYTNTPNLALLGNPSTAFTGGYNNWSNFSDGRFKKNMDENVKGLDFIMRLRPVTYHMDVRGLYKFWGISPNGKEDSSANKNSSVNIDDAITKKEAIRMSGFVAQEVEKAAADSHYDFDGVIKPSHDKDHYRLAYGEFVVPLVKAMQEQQAMIKTQQQQIDMLMKRIEALEKK